MTRRGVAADRFCVKGEGYIQYCFTATEVTFTIMCACGPALKVYFNKSPNEGSFERAESRSSDTSKEARATRMRMRNDDDLLESKVAPQSPSESSDSDLTLSAFTIRYPEKVDLELGKA